MQKTSLDIALIVFVPTEHFCCTKNNVAQMEDLYVDAYWVARHPVVGGIVQRIHERWRYEINLLNYLKRMCNQ